MGTTSLVTSGMHALACLFHFKRCHQTRGFFKRLLSIKADDLVNDIPLVKLTVARGSFQCLFQSAAALNAALTYDIAVPCVKMFKAF